MNSLFANSINQKRIIMFASAGIFGILTNLIFYQVPFSGLTIWDPINTALVGLLVFESLYRAKRWLSLKTIPVFVILVTLISQWLYFTLYGIENGSIRIDLSLFSEPFRYFFTTFPYNLYFLIESLIVTGFAYYLIILSEVTFLEQVNDLSKFDVLTGVIVGAVMASFGGAIKYYLALSGFEWAARGILLPFYLCLITPIVGGVLGWIGAMATHKISKSRISVFLGGLLGGLLTVLALLPAPYIAQ